MTNKPPANAENNAEISEKVPDGESKPWRESDDVPERGEAWRKFMRERLEIEPGQEKYVASGFSLRDMWIVFANGYQSGRVDEHAALAEALRERDELKEHLELKERYFKAEADAKNMDAFLKLTAELNSAKEEIENWKRIAGERESWFRTKDFECNNMFADLNDEKKLVAELRERLKAHGIKSDI